MRRGQTVVAARSLGMMRAVPKGTPGVIRSVSFLGTYTVDFGGKVLTEIKRDDVIVPGAGAPLSGSGCLIYVAGCCAASAALARVAWHLRRG